MSKLIYTDLKICPEKEVHIQAYAYKLWLCKHINVDF